MEEKIMLNGSANTLEGEEETRGKTEKAFSYLIIPLSFIILILLYLLTKFPSLSFQYSTETRLLTTIDIVSFLAVLIILRPKLGFLLFIALLSIQNVLAVKGISNDLILSVAESFLIILIRFSRRKRVNNLRLPYVFYILFVAYCFLSAVSVMNFSKISDSYPTLLNLGNIIIFGFVVYGLGPFLKLEDIKRGMVVYIYSWALICIYLLIQSGLSGRLGMSENLNPNGIAPYIATCIIFLNSKLIPSKIAVILLNCLFVFALIFTGTRTGIISLGIGLAVYILFLKGFKRKFLLACAFGILGLGLNSITAYIAPQITARYQVSSTSLSSLESVNDFSSQRISIWENAIIVFEQNPIFGVGLGEFSNYTLERSNIFIEGAGAAAHSMYLEILTELGLLGMLLFLPFIVSFIKRAVELTRYSPLSLSILAVFLAIGISGSFFMNINVGFFFVAAYALTTSITPPILENTTTTKGNLL